MGGTQSSEQVVCIDSIEVNDKDLYIDELQSGIDKKVISKRVKKRLERLKVDVNEEPNLWVLLGSNPEKKVEKEKDLKEKLKEDLKGKKDKRKAVSQFQFYNTSIKKPKIHFQHKKEVIVLQQPVK